MEEKQKSESYILGTCARLGDSFGFDPLWFRIGFVLFGASGSGLIIYLVLGLLLDD